MVFSYSIEKAVTLISNRLSHMALDVLTQQIKAGSFPNTLIVKGEDDKGIVIDDVRKALTFAYATPTLQAPKVVIFHGVDRMTRQAANALLKLIEEPRAGVFIFLTASNLSAVLPTLKSRCHREKVMSGIDNTDDVIASLITLHKDIVAEPSLENCRKFFALHHFYQRTKNAHLNEDTFKKAASLFN